MGLVSIYMELMMNWVHILFLCSRRHCLVETYPGEVGEDMFSTFRQVMLPWQRVISNSQYYL